jgi:hypothetical protein
MALPRSPKSGLTAVLTRRGWDGRTCSASWVPGSRLGRLLNAARVSLPPCPICLPKIVPPACRPQINTSSYLLLLYLICQRRATFMEFVEWVRQGLEAGEYEDHPA